MVKKSVLQILYTLAIVLAGLALVSCASSTTSEDAPAVTDVRAALSDDSTTMDVTWTAPSGENLWGVYVEVRNGNGATLTSSAIEGVTTAGTASIPIWGASSDEEKFTVAVSLISAAADRTFLSTVVSEPVGVPITGRTPPAVIAADAVGELDRYVPEVRLETALSYPWTWGVTLQWPAPTDAGTTAGDTSATISHYDLYWASSGKTLSTWNYDGKLRTVGSENVLINSIEPLSAAVGTYNVMIVTTNSAGLTSTTMAGSYNAPTPPAAVTPKLVLTPGSESTSITVSWEAPANPGTTNGADSSTISRYAVAYAAGEIKDGSQLTQIAGADTTHTIDHLTAGLEYEVAVYAYNEIGLRSDFTSAKITLEAANPNATAPAALPTTEARYSTPAVRYAADDKGEIVLMWDLPVDHALGTTDGATPAELAGFVIEYNKSGDSPTRVVLSNAADYTTSEDSLALLDMGKFLSEGTLDIMRSSYQYTIKGLEMGDYEVSISVLNNAALVSDPLSVGMSDGKGGPTVVTVPNITLPAPVTGLKLVAKNSSTLVVEWDIPAAGSFGTADGEDLVFTTYGIAYVEASNGRIDPSTLKFDLQDGPGVPDNPSATRTSKEITDLTPNTEYVVAVRIMARSSVDIRIPPYAVFAEENKITMPADNSVPPQFAQDVGLTVEDMMLAASNSRQGVKVTWPSYTPGTKFDGSTPDPVTKIKVSMNLPGTDVSLFEKTLDVSDPPQQSLEIELSEIADELIGPEVVFAVDIIPESAVEQKLPGEKITKLVSLKAYVAPTLRVTTTLSYTSIEVGLATTRGTGILGDPLPAAGKTISWTPAGTTTGSADLTATEATEESHTITGLRPNTAYTIEVTYNLPTFDVSASTAVTTPEDKSTPPTISDLVITDALLTSSPAQGVELKWQATAGKQQDGTTDAIDIFTIRVTNAADASFEQTPGPDARSTVITAQELQAFISSTDSATFTVTVTTDGKKTATASVERTLSAYTAPVFTLSPPTPTDTTIPVSWDVTGEGKSTGTGILGDTLSLTEAVVDWAIGNTKVGTTKGSGNLAPTDTSYTITGLSTRTEYTVTVTLSNGATTGVSKTEYYSTTGTPPAQ